jgi:molecular chaperone GrpE
VKRVFEEDGKKSREETGRGPCPEDKAPEEGETRTGKGEPMPAKAPCPGGPEARVGEVSEANVPQTGPESAAPGPEGQLDRPDVTPEEKAERLLREKAELEDKFVRLLADFDNYRKRASKEKSDAIRFGNEGLLADFLPIVDNIERLLNFSYQEGSWQSFREGIELLLAEIGKTLEKYGVEPIEALGKPFDPNLHQAMQRSETQEAEANTVLEVYQKGYLYQGRLLRPSLVAVAVPPKAAEEGSPQGEDPSAEGPNPKRGGEAMPEKGQGSPSDG